MRKSENTKKGEKRRFTVRRQILFTESQFLEKIKVTDMLVGMQHPGAGDSDGDSRCTPGAESWTRW